MLIYVYDIKIKGKREYNTIKRRFYYWLNKFKQKCEKTGEKFIFISKSVVLIPEKFENEFDDLLLSFQPFLKFSKIKGEMRIESF